MPKAPPKKHTLDLAIQRLNGLLGLIEEVPPEWIPVVGHTQRGAPEAACCTTYSEMINAWKKAMRWRQGMDDVLSVMLAVAASTSQVGDQLFLFVIGDAGSGKTRLCDGMLTSDHCYALEHLTGFHSGYKGEGDEDFSLISRINHKTLITPEGDVVMSSPHFHEIMSQQRRIFDGTSGATYKNRAEDMRYTGLRTPWIIAGTPALMATDQSRLGDRFLRICFDSVSLDEERDILRRVGFTSLRTVAMISDGTADSHVEENLNLAYKMTGGYVNWLRARFADEFSKLDIDEEAVVECCMTLGEFTAYMRARPDPDPKKDVPVTKEMPTRLTSQFTRMAACLAVVLNRRTIDDEVMRRTRKVALDTSRGITLDIARKLWDIPGGVSVAALVSTLGKSPAKVLEILQFMSKIRVVEVHNAPEGGKG